MQPVQIILVTSLGLKIHERCLVVHDDPMRSIAESIFDAASTISTAELLAIPRLRTSGEEPPLWVSKKMLEHDVIVLVTSKSLSHTNARKNATDNGARLVSMPGITEDILNRAIDVDYSCMKKVTDRVADILDKGKIVHVLSENGTDLTMDISSRIAHGRNAGLFHNKGQWGNLPEGEAFIAPVEGTANGVYLVDASQAGIGKVIQPIRIDVANGIATDFTGGKSLLLRRQLNAVGADAFNIAEFGIGTNPKAIVSGTVLEDEKVLGTCHIALGNNIGFGGITDVPVHVDGVIMKPSIIVDGKQVMEKGVLLV